MWAGAGMGWWGLVGEERSGTSHKDRYASVEGLEFLGSKWRGRAQGEVPGGRTRKELSLGGEG